MGIYNLGLMADAVQVGAWLVGPPNRREGPQSGPKTIQHELAGERLSGFSACATAVLQMLGVAGFGAALRPFAGKPRSYGSSASPESEPEREICRYPCSSLASPTGSPPSLRAALYLWELACQR